MEGEQRKTESMAETARSNAQAPLRKLLTDITLTPVQGRKTVCVAAFGLL